MNFRAQDPGAAGGGALGQVRCLGPPWTFGDGGCGGKFWTQGAICTYIAPTPRNSPFLVAARLLSLPTDMFPVPPSLLALSMASLGTWHGQ